MEKYIVHNDGIVNINVFSEIEKSIWERHFDINIKISSYRDVTITFSKRDEMEDAFGRICNFLASPDETILDLTGKYVANTNKKTQI